MEVRRGFKKTLDRIVTVGKERIKAKGLHSNRGKRIEVKHRFREEEEARRIDRQEMLKHGFGRRVTNASTVSIENLNH